VPPRPVVEVAVDSLDAAEMAWSLGADRIELCQALELGGLSPSRGLIEVVAAKALGPVFVMIRPRPGDFVVGPNDLAVMMSDVAAAKAAGCSGIVTGALSPTREIDAEAVERLVTAAGGLPVTFHRAFDLCAEPARALDRLVELGVKRILTAGDGATAFEGRQRIAMLAGRAGTAMTVIAGGGVTGDHVVELVTTTGVREVHLSGSFQVRADRSGGFGMNTLPNPARMMRVIDAIDQVFGRKEVGP
jgi:copper homeostasis protein